VDQWAKLIRPSGGSRKKNLNMVVLNMKMEFLERLLDYSKNLEVVLF
jgi:hypothetical protein